MPATVTPSVLGGLLMGAVMIGVDPHKGSHTAVAISPAEEPLGELRVRASAAQVQRLLAWAAAWPERTWAIEGAGGLGHLLARQLAAAGERVLDVQPKPRGHPGCGPCGAPGRPPPAGCPAGLAPWPRAPPHPRSSDERQDTKPLVVAAFTVVTGANNDDGGLADGHVSTHCGSST